METVDNQVRELEFLQKLQDQKEIEIKPCDANINLDAEKEFVKLQMTDVQKLQVSQLIGYLPNALAIGNMAGAYKVTFPQGLPHTLVALRQGGYGSQIMDNGRIVGSASFHPMLGQAVVYGVFSLMSIITGQFFLKKINENLNTINQKLDDILRFMYGDKKAELLSEVGFVKYACDNYVPIMTYGVQRTATIIGIQEAKKIATKDIEFYLNDFKEQVKSGEKAANLNALKELVEKKIFETGKNLKLSLQLYQISSLLEIYYAQNFEEGYIEYLAKDIKMYAKKYNDEVFTHYGSLEAKLNNLKPTNQGQLAVWNDLNERLEEAKDSHGKVYDEVCDRLSDIVKTSIKPACYYLKTDGNVYKALS